MYIPLCTCVRIDVGNFNLFFFLHGEGSLLYLCKLVLYSYNVSLSHANEVLRVWGKTCTHGNLSVLFANLLCFLLNSSWISGTQGNVILPNTFS